MNRLNKALIVASFVVLPLVGHAADNAPLTRAQVRADLIAAEQNGTFPLSKVHYPDPAYDPSAVYVANKFKAAGMETTIVPYRAWLNLPESVRVEATDGSGQLLMQGPSKEHVSADPYQDDPRVLPAFNGSSPSGDITGDVVYANYGRPEDFDKLADDKIDLHGKIVLVRYGGNFRGVKVYIAQLRGAAGHLAFAQPELLRWRGGRPARGPAALHLER